MNNRIPGLLRILLTILFISLLSAVNVLPEENSLDKPNVILIIIDDVGYGDLAMHGNPYVTTPNLDKLGSESVRLTDFHVNPTCSPTRAALMTGRYCNRTGVWHTIMGRSLLRADEVTMADVFKSGGYKTGMFGKWHLGDNYPFRPHDRGFDESVMHPGGGIIQGLDHWGNDYFDDTYLRNGEPEKFKGYCTDVWFQEAFKFIETNKDNPFFCYISTNAAHWPFWVEEKFSAPYKSKGLESPRAEFYGMITNIDDNIGRLLKYLDNTNLADNTVVMFMTDNGADPAGNWERYKGGMRGFKGSKYDGGHRVPFFIRWPGGQLTGGREVERLTAHIDILPTLIELCGIDSPNNVNFDGTSLVPLLKGKGSEWFERILITDSQRVDFPIKWRKSATMTDKWRLIDGIELYDIKSDPEQQADVASSNQEVVAKLRTAYENWWEDISRNFQVYPRIVVGSDNQNPTCLMSHDIHGKVVWNHYQVKDGARADGFWAVEVERDGEYEFFVRRWPEGVEQPVTFNMDDDEDDEQWVIEATDARLKVAGVDLTKPVVKGDAGVKFNIKLNAGKTRVQAWFVDGKDDGQTFGAYYVYVRRI